MSDRVEVPEEGWVTIAREFPAAAPSMAKNAERRLRQLGWVQFTEEEREALSEASRLAVLGAYPFDAGAISSRPCGSDSTSGGGP